MASTGGESEEEAGDEVKFNKWRGVIPETKLDKERAKHAGLGTVKPQFGCRACVSCQYYGSQNAVAYCSHPELKQMVSANQGCRYWRNDSAWLPAK